MKQIKPSEISPTIAELLEPKPQIAGYKRESQGMTSRLGAWRTEGYGADWVAIDFERDPCGTVMLLKAMPSVFLCNFSESQEWECAADRWTDVDSYVKASTLEQAVTRAFLASHQIEVKE